MDRRQIVGEPPRQVDVGDRAAFSPEGVGKLGEGTAESVRREDQALAADHRCRQRGTPIGALRESRGEQVDHARLNREPGQGVDDLDGHEHCSWPGSMLMQLMGKAATAQHAIWAAVCIHAAAHFPGGFLPPAAVADLLAGKADRAGMVGMVDPAGTAPGRADTPAETLCSGHP